MKRVNIRLVIILFLVGFLGTAATYALYRFQQQRLAKGLLRIVDQRLAEEDSEDAIQYLTLYTYKKPEDTDQVKRLAQIMKSHVDDLTKRREMDSRKSSEAYTVLERAARLCPDDIEVQETMINFLMPRRAYSDAIDYLRRLIDSHGDKAKPDWRLKLALCYHQIGDYETSLPMLAEMVGWDRGTRTANPEKAIAPDNLQAYSTLAFILRSQRNLPKEADQVIAVMVEQNPDNYLAYVQRARYLLSVAEGKAAAEQITQDVKKALQLGSDKSESLLLAADQALKDKDLPRARGLYSRCHELHPDMNEPLVGLAQWAIRQQKWDKAVEYLDKGLEVSPDNPNVLYFKAVVQLEANQWNEFEKTLAEFRRSQSGNPLVKYLEGRRLILKQQWLQGSRMLAEVRQQVELLQPQLLDMLDRSLAVAYQKLGQMDLQLEAMNNLVARHPGDIDLRLLRMQCLLGLRQEAKAVGDYEYIEELLRGDPEQAERRTAERLRFELIKQERLPETVRDWKKATALAQTLANQKDVVPALKQSLLQDLARLMGREGVSGEGVPSSTVGRLVAQLNDIKRSIYSKSLDEVLQELDALEAQAGPIVQARMLRGEAIAYHRPDNAQELLAAIEEAPEAYNEDQRRRWKMDLGRFYVEAGLRDDGNRVMRQLLAEDPNDIQLRLRLYELTLAAGDDAATRRALDEIEASVGRDSPQWKWARASQLAAQVRDGKLPPERLENAMSLVTDAKNSRANWAQLYLLEGDIAVLRDDPEAAAKSFERARQLGSDNPNAVRNLVGIYYRRQDFDQAQAALQALPRPLWGNRERQIQLHLLAMRGELPEDLNVTEMANDAEGFAWLGRLMTDADRSADAIHAYRMAIDLKPDSPLTWIGLLNATLRFGGKEEAKKILDEAKDAVREDAQTSFLATSYRLLGDFDNGEIYYSQMLQQHPEKLNVLQDVAAFYLEFKLPDKARPIIEKILAVKDASDAPRIVRWARRMRARDVASQKSYENYQAAVKLLEANRTEQGPLERDDLLLLGQLTLARLESPSRQAAMDEFKLAGDFRPLGFEESLLMAQLQNALGDWQGCKRTMTELLAVNLQKNRAGKENAKLLDPRILDPYLRLLLEHDDLAEARKWLKNCAPDSGTAIRTRAHLLVRRGRTQQAIDLLRQLLSDDGSNEQQLLFIAGLAEELGKYDPIMFAAAEAAWRRLVAVRPDASSSYINFLLRRPDPDRADDIMQLVQQLYESGTTLPAIQQAIVLLRSLPPGLPRQDDYEQTIRDWLSAGRQAEPGNSSYVIQEAELEGAVGNESRQESLLRNYLASHPEKNVSQAIVCNNLAYIEAIKGNGVAAKRLIDDAVGILGPVASLRDTIGMAHLASEEWEAAIDSFQTAIDQGQQSAISYYHLARAQWQTGQRQPAADSMAKAMNAGLTEASFAPSELRQFKKFIKEMESAGFAMPAEKTTEKPSAAIDQRT